VGFLNTPKTLSFSRLELIGHDHEPPLVVGTGEVRMTSSMDFAFTLTGTPADIGYALSAVNRPQKEPYDALARCRLVGVDGEGVSWAGGYTIPRVENGDPAWMFTGEIDSLVTNDQSSTASRQASTELIFLVPPEHLMALAMARFTRTDQVGGESHRKHVMEVLGSNIQFAYDASASTLSITASHSANLPATFTDNWLSEPLRIMFGQLIYPRLVARNFGDGRACVWVRPSPGLIRAARWAALWNGYGLKDKEAFWSRYAELLGLIALARDENEHPNFEPHKVTRLYEECIQAARGSRWVWALTFASSIEALVKMLIPKDTKPTKAEAEAIAALVKHISVGPGEKRLKQIAVNAVHRDAKITTIKALRELRTAGVITDEQLSAWETIRHAVMHGDLLISH
jgi:hypothetical protein